MKRLSTSPVLWILLLTLAAAGCTGGGGGGSDAPPTPPAAQAATVGGTGVKGPFAEGSPVTFYRLSSGRLGPVVGSGNTASGGRFSIKLSDASYSGPLLMTISGTFANESGGTDTIAASAPLFAALPLLTARHNESGLVITPLTDLAYQLANGRGPLTQSSLEAAAAEIGSRFGIADVLRTLPTDPSAQSAGGDSVELRYGLLLAGFTQQARAKGVSVESLLRTLENDASDGTLDGNAASPSIPGYTASVFGTALASSIDQFLASANNRTSLTSAPAELRTQLTRAYLVLGRLGLPLAVARGQNVVATLQVTNTGGNPARLDQARVIASQTGLTITTDSGNPLTLAAGATATLRFNVAVAADAPAGNPTLRAELAATDLVSGLSAGAVRADAGTLPIQEPSSLTISALQMLGTVPQGGNFDVVMPVTNSGGTAARILAAGLVFSQNGFTVTTDAGNAATIEPGETVGLRFRVVAGSSAPLGVTQVDAQVLAQDVLGGTTGLAERHLAGTIRVLSPATLAIGTFTGPASAVQGQTVVISLPVTNSGEASATIQGVSLGFGSTDLTARAMTGNPVSISPGITSNFRFQVTAAPNTAGRVFVASAAVQAIDAATGLPLTITRANAGTLVILRPAAVTVTALAMPSPVSVGQSFTATVSISNTGESTADVGLVQLTFDTAGVNSVAAVSNPGSLVPGQTGTFRVTVVVSSAAAPGQVHGSVTVVATDRLSGVDAGSSADNVGVTTVQTRATLAAVGLLMPSRVSKGQSFTATLTVQNAGQAAARLTAASLTFSNRALTATPRSDNPRTVPGQGTASLVFDASASAAAVSGISTAGATLSGHDANSLAPIVAVSPDLGRTLIVEAPAALAVGPVSGLTRVSQGQSFTVTASVQNTGEAGAELLGGTLTFSNPEVGASLTGPAPLPLLGAGQGATLAFLVTAGATAAPGTVTAVLEASARDTNSRLTVRGSRTSAFTLVVDTPANVSVRTLSATTNLVSQGQTFLVAATLQNSGTATAIVTSVGLELGAGGMNSPAFTTTRSLAGGGLTTYTFSVSVPLTATAGAVLIGTRVSARDANSGNALTVPQAISRPTVTVQTRAALRVTSILFGRPSPTLTQGQSTSVSVTFRNDGQAAARLTGAQLLLDRPLLTVSAQPASGNLAGSASRTFVFPVQASSTATGVVAINGNATAFDGNSGASVPVTRGSTLTVTVQRPAQLVLEAITPRRPTLSLGQTISATVVLRNSGEAALTITQASLVRDLPRVTLSSFTGAVTLAAGQGSGNSVLINLTGVSVGQVRFATATVAATENNTGRAVQLINGLATPASVTVQESAGIRIDSAQLPPTVSRGQTFSVTATIANTGEASLRLTTVSAAFYDQPVLTTSLVPPLPAPIGSYTTATVRFNVTVPATAPTGVAHLRLDATGVDDNTGGPDLDAMLQPAGQVTVQTPPSLVILPLIKQSTASRGQTFTVTIPVRNNGQATARITGASLVWRSPSLTSSVAAGNLTTVAAGQTRNFRMNVTVSSTAPLGAQTSVATVTAVDTNSGAALPPATFGSLDPTTIQVPAALTILSYRGPALVSQGQTFTATVGVKNTGGARARIRDAVLTFSRSGLSAYLSSPLTPAYVNATATTTTTLLFTCFVDPTAQTGVSNVDATVSANDANGDHLDITALRTAIGTLTVQAPATLQLVSLGTPPTISQGQTVSVSLSVRNTGDARAVLDTYFLRLDPLKFSSSAHASNPTSIAGGQTAKLFFNLNCAAGATPGTTSAGADVAGHDLNSNTLLAVANYTMTQLTVQRPPMLSLGELHSPPARVSRGQVLRLYVPVTNSPDAAVAVFNGPTLIGHSGGFSAVTTAPTPSSVASGQTTRLVFLTTISESAPLGNNFLRCTVPYLDRNTGLLTGTAQKDPLGPIEVQEGARLSTSYTQSQTSVTQGQSLITTITIGNESGAAGAAATGTSVTFTRSETTFQVALTPPPATIPGGTTVTARLTITTLSPSTPAGTKTVTVQVSANDANAGAPTTGTVRVFTVSFVVQVRPVLVAETPSVPVSISRGEVQVPVRVNYRNATASGAAARLTGSSLRFYANGTVDVTNEYSQHLATTLPVVVPAGQSRPLDFTFSITPTATLGPIAVTVSSTAVDHNDLTPLTVAAPASRYTTMTESRPVLRIAGPDNQRPGVFPQRSLISTGQLVPFRLEVRNFGGSSARIGAAPSLSFFAGVVDKTSEYASALTSGAGKFVAAASGGNTTAVTMTFDVTPSTGATALGLIQVGATVPATGTVNGVVGSDVSTGVIPPVSAGSFLLQSRVAVQATDVFFDPTVPQGVDRSSTTSPEQLLLSRVSVQVRISNNNGLNGASMNVSNVSLRLTTSSPTTLINSEYALAPTTFTPFTISGNASRVVTFTLSAKPTAQKAVTVWLTPRVVTADANVGTTSTLDGTPDFWVVRDRAWGLRGQSGFASAVTAPPTQDRLNGPLDCISDGQRVFVADTQNSRVLIFASLTATSATTVIGQANFTSGAVNGGLVASASTLYAPAGLALYNNRLIVVDSGNNRVLIFNNYPSLPTVGATANVVLGQANFTGSGANAGGGSSITANGLSNPRGATVIQDKLLISDRGNSRVLVYDPVPLTTTPANRIIGQAYVNQGSPNRGSGSPTANTLAFPAGLATDGLRLFIADQGNDRLLVYFNVPVGDGAAADRVLGQTDFISGAASRPTTAGTLNSPTGVSAALDKLFVADTGNHRVVVHANPAVTAQFLNGAAAMDMVGQRYLTDSLLNNTVSGTRDAFSLSSPATVTTTSLLDDANLFVTDTGNSRILLVPLP